MIKKLKKKQRKIRKKYLEHLSLNSNHRVVLTYTQSHIKELIKEKFGLTNAQRFIAGLYVSKDRDNHIMILLTRILIILNCFYRNANLNIDYPANLLKLILFYALNGISVTMEYGNVTTNAHGYRSRCLKKWYPNVMDVIIKKKQHLQSKWRSHTFSVGRRNMKKYLSSITNFKSVQLMPEINITNNNDYYRLIIEIKRGPQKKIMLKCYALRRRLQNDKEYGLSNNIMHLNPFSQNLVLLISMYGHEAIIDLSRKERYHRTFEQGINRDTTYIEGEVFFKRVIKDYGDCGINGYERYRRHFINNIEKEKYSLLELANNSTQHKSSITLTVYTGVKLNGYFHHFKQIRAPSVQQQQLNCMHHWAPQYYHQPYLCKKCGVIVMHASSLNRIINGYQDLNWLLMKYSYNGDVMVDYAQMVEHLNYFNDNMSGNVILTLQKHIAGYGASLEVYYTAFARYYYLEMPPVDYIVNWLGFNPDFYRNVIVRMDTNNVEYFGLVRNKVKSWSIQTIHH